MNEFPQTTVGYWPIQWGSNSSCTYKTPSYPLPIPIPTPQIEFINELAIRLKILHEMGEDEWKKLVDYLFIHYQLVLQPLVKVECEPL